MRGNLFIILGLIIAILLLLALTLKIFSSGNEPYYWSLFIFILIGFVAQIIDGAIGMAYGVFSNSFLLSVGVPPALASASIHTAEIFTTLASGVSHLKLGNVDRQIFRDLVITGMTGGCVGAYILSSMQTDFMRTLVNIYLLLMGIVIFIKAIKFTILGNPSFKGVKLLGGIGGFLDAIGGGGWGPIVTSALIVRNCNPRLVIGSVNLAEFFVTIVESAAFFIILGIIDLKLIIGLTLGGLIASPISAYICKKAPIRALMMSVGILLVILALRNLK